MKANDIFKKLTKTKGIGFIILGIVAGILLLLMPKNEGEVTVQVSSPSPCDEYCAMLEQKTEALINELPNVDSCSVFITLESGYKYVYATDQHINEQENGKETDKTIVLADNAEGEAPILIQETLPAVSGVAVVCADASYETQYKIIELICALFNIPSNRISIQT